MNDPSTHGVCARIVERDALSLRAVLRDPPVLRDPSVLRAPAKS